MLDAYDKSSSLPGHARSHRFSGLKVNIESAVFALSQNILRSFLTLTGIVIGVLSIVTLVAIMQGVKAEVSKQVEGLGANMVVIVPGKLDENGQPNPMSLMGHSTLVQRDIEMLRAVPGVEKVSPVLFVFGSVDRMLGNGKTNTYGGAFVVATNRAGIEMNPTPLREGRYFDDAPADRYTCVLGSKTREELFGTGEALGQTISVQDKKWKVVGVLNKPTNGGTLSGQLLSLNNLVYLPEKTALHDIPSLQINRIVLKTDYRHPADKMLDAMTAALLASHNNHEDFGIITLKRGLALAIQLVSMAQDLLVLIAAISLFVAGIGIMNIMLVTVTERTREIGVRKTVGARRSDIFAQFLTEAVILSLFGGAIGIALSTIICAVIGHRTALQPQITPSIVGMALAICICVGIVFGVAPAVRAANLNPIDALRHE